MAGVRRIHSDEDDFESANRQTASLAGMAVTLAVLVACVFLVKQLTFKSHVEDCLMAGRNTCDVVAIRAR